MKHRILAMALALVLAVFPCLRASAAGKGFPDVRPGAWYEKEVAEMAGKGFFRGYENNTFQPDRPISFAEFVTVAARCVSFEAGPGDGRHWASGIMEAAREAGWYDWDECPPDDLARWNQAIPRQVAAKVLMKAFAPEERGEYAAWAGQIKDFREIDGRYYEGVLAAYQNGILLGDNRGNFRPRRGITRAESCAVFSRALKRFPQEGAGPAPEPAPNPVSGGVSENGWLQVKGTKLCNQQGQPVMLRGMSSHGLQWYPQFASKSAVSFTAKHGANVFRAAMYTGEGGYLSHKEEMKRRVTQAVDAALSQDLYAVIDWHILSDGNPNAHTAEAKAFFREMSKKYGDQPGVIYEICNEPNGNVSWEDISRYASQVIPVIRENSPRAVILCGTPTWSQDVDIAAKHPLPYQNVLYTLHFYAGTHGQNLRGKAEAALQAGLPLFVSEWGVSDASGSGGAYLKESGEWLSFLEARGISWINWSLCDKRESSAALRPGASASGLRESDLSESGKFVFARFP